MMIDAILWLKSHGMRIELGDADGRTDGRTDGRMDRRTDTPACRDARTHLNEAVCTPLHGYISCVRLGRGINKSLQASKQQNRQSKIDNTIGRTDGRPDIASYRVAFTRLKIT